MLKGFYNVGLEWNCNVETILMTIKRMVEEQLQCKNGFISWL